MKTIRVYKNSGGYGPTTRPKLEIGEVIKVVFMDTGESREYMVMPAEPYGRRCGICDLHGHEEYSRCLMNDDNLNEDNSDGAICTIKWSPIPEDRVLSVFRSIDKILEDL